jgi:hypothetical protein
MPDRPATRQRPAEPDDALAQLNDHLGRFLRQADDLLDEWTRYSAEVRARVDREVAHLGDSLADATDVSIGRVVSRVESEVADRLVARLHRAAAATVRESNRRTSRIAVAALVAALLADILLVLLLLRPPPPEVRGTEVRGTEVRGTEVRGTEGVAIDAGVREPDSAGAAAIVDAGVAATPDAGAAKADAEVKPAGKHGATKAPPRRRRK